MLITWSALYRRLLFVLRAQWSWRRGVRLPECAQCHSVMTDGESWTCLTCQADAVKTAAEQPNAARSLWELAGPHHALAPNPYLAPMAQQATNHQHLAALGAIGGVGGSPLGMLGALGGIFGQRH